MKIIAGLGNPGTRYEKTRHNIGKRALFYWLSGQNKNFSEKKKLQAEIAEDFIGSEKVIFACPTTFMNLSGTAVRAVTDYFGVDPATDLLVIADDTALPFGKLRIRTQGSSGGHNGILSIEEAFGSLAYGRLRVGVGSNEEEGQRKLPLEDYVLSNFTLDEEKALPECFERVVEASKQWVIEGAISAMNRVNGPAEQSS